MSQPVPMPVFGTHQAGAVYLPRLAAYAVISNPGGRVAVVQMDGEWHLPGGSLQAGETHPEALARLLTAQFGSTGELNDLIAQADEYYFSARENRHIQLQCNLYTVNLPPAAGQPPAVEWLPPDEAARRLSLVCHAWAVRQVYEW